MKNLGGCQTQRLKSGASFMIKLIRSESFSKNELPDRIFVCKIMSWVVLI